MIMEDIVGIYDEETVEIYCDKCESYFKAQLK